MNRLRIECKELSLFGWQQKGGVAGLVSWCWGETWHLMIEVAGNKRLLDETDQSHCVVVAFGKVSNEATNFATILFFSQIKNSKKKEKNK